MDTQLTPTPTKSLCFSKKTIAPGLRDGSKSTTKPGAGGGFLESLSESVLDITATVTCPRWKQHGLLNQFNYGESDKLLGF
jgi:hypothetical protein